MQFEIDRLATRLDELAYLNAGLKLRLTDLRGLNPVTESIIQPSGDRFDQDSVSILNTRGETSRCQEFIHLGGISELVKELCVDKQSIHPSLSVIVAK
jgi:DNA gyrase/topoisomerase IV subunit B